MHLTSRVPGTPAAPLPITHMPQEVILWIAGLAAAVIGTLALVLLRRVLDGLDRVDTKLTEQGLSVARIENTVTSLHGRVDSLEGWRSRLQERAVEAAEERYRALEDERRHGPPDRRGII